MNVAEAAARYLASLGVTDAFGIPGGVILDFLYALDAQSGITPHLTYHEQSAGFAACGYAQSGGVLGVAYATRGPGFTNLITPLTDAFCDSLPVLFVTAHADDDIPPAGMRVRSDQELDTCSMVRKVTKLASRVETVEDFLELFPKACGMATDGRKGPVFLDFSARLFREDIPRDIESCACSQLPAVDERMLGELHEAVRSARRPVVLVGDGISQAGEAATFRRWAGELPLPMISSRFCHDIVADCDNYFGYVGSHGIRAANFILSKTDLVVSLGNRLHFPVQSKSFAPIWNRAKLLRFEIDEGEFLRKIPNSRNYHVDVRSLVRRLANERPEVWGRHDEWLSVCRTLGARLVRSDCNSTVTRLAHLLSQLPNDALVVNDVGNLEFGVSRACVLARLKNRTLYSKSLGALGCALGKAIGAHYATNKPVACVVGDQGLMMNVQDLHSIAQHSLPVVVVVVNNGESGMIRDKEELRFGRLLHTTSETGFLSPEVSRVAQMVGLRYRALSENDVAECQDLMGDMPSLVDFRVKGGLPLTPFVPVGNPCQEMSPPLGDDCYEELNKL